MKISIIIATYNRAELLPRAIASIPLDAQAEIIIVDDGSTDTTVKVVQDLMQKDNRIVFALRSRNGGVNAARNTGIEKAKGKWIVFLDSDDEYIPGGFDILNSALEKVSECIDVVGLMTLREVEGVMEPRGFRVGESWVTYEPSYEGVLFKERHSGDIHYCIRRAVFIQGYKFADYINGFESAFLAKLAKDGKKFLYVNNVVTMCHSGGDVHLSTEPYKRWPRQFARAYREFVQEHFTALRQRPVFLLHYYLRIAKCSLFVGDVRGLWWLARAVVLKFEIKFLNRERLG